MYIKNMQEKKDSEYITYLYHIVNEHFWRNLNFSRLPVCQPYAHSKMLCGFFCRGARALWAGEDSFDILPVDNPRSAHIHAHTWLYIFNVDINQPRSCVTPCVLYVWFTLSILWCCVCACVCFVSYSLWSVRAMLSWLITLKHTHESCTNNNNNNKKHRTRPYFLSHAFHTHTEKQNDFLRTSRLGVKAISKL